MKQTQHSATGARRDHVTGSLADGVDQLIVSDTWSDLRNSREAPEIDVDRPRAYRTSRLRPEIERAQVGLLILINPLSLRYALDDEGYAWFQAHIPETYLFYPADGPTVLHGASGPPPTTVDEVRRAHSVS